MRGMVVPLRSPRRDLLANVLAAAPRLLVLYAPSGYGKTTFIQRYLEDRAHVMCDCSSGGATGLAQRLAQAFPDVRWNVFGGHAQEWADGFRRALERVKSPLTLVFDNGEALVDDREARDFLARLLYVRNEAVSVIIASQVVLPLRLSQFAYAHETMNLGAADLRLDRTAVAEMLGIEDEATIDRVYRATDGWPIAVRWIADHLPDVPLQRLLDPARHEIADATAATRVTDTVIAKLDEPLRARLLSLILTQGNIPDSDLALASTHAASIERTLESCMLTTRTAPERAEVHPLLRKALLSRDEGAFNQLYSNLYRALMQRMEFVRAAEYAVANGANIHAEAALARVRPFDSPEALAHSSIAPLLDRETILRHPFLWLATLAARSREIPQHELLGEARAVIDSLGESAPPVARLFAYAIAIICCTDFGMITDAHLLADEALHVAHGAQDDYATAIAALCARSVDAFAGNHVEIAELDELGVTIEKEDYLLILGLLFRTQILAAALDGNRARLQRLCQRALDIESDAIDHAIGEPLWTAVWFAWLIDDGQTSELGLRRLERATDTFRAPQRRAIAAARRRDILDGGERPVIRVQGYLMLAASAQSAATRAEYLHRAMRSARQTGSCWWEGLILLAIAASGSCSPAEIDRVLPPLERANLTSLSNALVAMRDGTRVPTFFASFVARFETIATLGRRFEISLCRGTVARDGAELELPPKSLALVLALAQSPSGARAQDLIDTLFSDTPRDGESALRSALSRVRSETGNDALIVREDDLYRLAPGVAVDLVRFGDLIRALHDHATLADEQRAHLDEAFAQLGNAGAWRQSVSRNADVEIRILELRAEIGRMLYDDAMRREDYARAHSTAEALLAIDPCDEDACELALKALFAAGDRSGALRVLRDYEKALEAELGARPSQRLMDYFAHIEE